VDYGGGASNKTPSGKEKKARWTIKVFRGPEKGLSSSGEEVTHQKKNYALQEELYPTL